MKDHYEMLGVTRSATDKQINDAFKKLARKFHPDLHPGDKEAEAKFKSISAANDLLKDKDSAGSLMQARSTPAGLSGRRSDSIATSLTGLFSPRMPHRMDLTATKSWRNSWQKRLPPEGNARRARSGRAAKM